MLRVNTAAIIQSAIALVVAITVADTLRETIKWLGGGDSTSGALGIRAAFTVLLLLAAVVILSHCGDHVLSLCGDHELPAPKTAETYRNTPRRTMDCGHWPCDVHKNMPHPQCESCMWAGNARCMRCEMNGH